LSDGPKENEGTNDVKDSTETPKTIVTSFAEERHKETSSETHIRHRKSKNLYNK